jgi:hypothetical protein
MRYINLYNHVIQPGRRSDEYTPLGYTTRLVRRQVSDLLSYQFLRLLLLERWGLDLDKTSRWFGERLGSEADEPWFLP